MSVSFAVLFPIVLLAIVSVFCFVGCDAGGLGGEFWGEIPPPFTQYSDLTVLSNLNLIAYWPLNDKIIGGVDPVNAQDASPNPAKGNYIDAKNTPSFYPWPVYGIPNLPNPVQSAAAPGTIAFQQSGIVAGDIVQPPGNPNVKTDCVVVNGGFVSVPIAPKFNLTSFTIEAWVRVDWDKNASQAWRFVLDARDFNPCTGFGILAMADDQQGVYHWQAIVGNGGMAEAGFTFLPSSDPPIILNDPTPEPPETTYYIALTYDGSLKELILYVSGQPRGTLKPVNYVANTTQALLIGAGSPLVPPGPEPTGVPLFPFDGAIQDVAVYKAALGANDILQHAKNGIGILN